MIASPIIAKLRCLINHPAEPFLCDLRKSALGRIETNSLGLKISAIEGSIVFFRSGFAGYGSVAVIFTTWQNLTKKPLEGSS